MVNAFDVLVTEVVPPDPEVSAFVAVRTLFVPTKLILKPEKVATPATAATVAVPESDPVPVLSERVTFAVASAPLVTVFPKES